MKNKNRVCLVIVLSVVVVSIFSIAYTQMIQSAQHEKSDLSLYQKLETSDFMAINEDEIIKLNHIFLYKFANQRGRFDVSNYFYRRGVKIR